MAHSTKSFGLFGLIAVLFGVLIIVPFIQRSSRIFEGFAGKPCANNTCPEGQFCEEVNVGTSTMSICHAKKP